MTSLICDFRTNPQALFLCNAMFHRQSNKVAIDNSFSVICLHSYVIYTHTTKTVYVKGVELVMSTDLLSFEHPSVLLFCFLDGHGRFSCEVRYLTPIGRFSMTIARVKLP